MEFKPQAAKFDALRSKTDRELLRLLLDELEMDTSRAYRAYATAVLLLPTMTGLAETEKRTLEERLQDARAKLNGALKRGAGR